MKSAALSLFIVLLTVAAHAQTNFYQPANAVFKQCNVIGVPGADYPQCNAIPLFDDVTPAWSASTFFSAGEQIQIVAQLNSNLSQTYIFQATNSGTSGTTEPQWNSPPYPPNAWTDVSDGSIVWSFVGGDASMGINVGTGQTLIYRGVWICSTNNCTRTSTSNPPGAFDYGFQYTDASGVVRQATVSGNWFQFRVCGTRTCMLKAGVTGTTVAPSGQTASSLYLCGSDRHACLR